MKSIKIKKIKLLSLMHDMNEQEYKEAVKEMHLNANMGNPTGISVEGELGAIISNLLLYLKNEDLQTEDDNYIDIKWSDFIRAYNISFVNKKIEYYWDLLSKFSK